MVDTSGTIQFSPWKGRLNTTKIFIFLRQESASKKGTQPWRNRSRLKTPKQFPPQLYAEEKSGPRGGYNTAKPDNQTTVSKAPAQSLCPFKEEVSKRHFNYLQICFQLLIMPNDDINYASIKIKCVLVSREKTKQKEYQMTLCCRWWEPGTLAALKKPKQVHMCSFS